jgi:VPS62-like protein
MARPVTEDRPPSDPEARFRVRMAGPVSEDRPPSDPEARFRVRMAGPVSEDRPPSDPEARSSATLLARYTPYLLYDSLESFRADSAAELPEGYLDDGSKWSYTNTLKHGNGSVIASAHPAQAEKQLDLAFLGRNYGDGSAAAVSDYLDEMGHDYVEDGRRLHANPQYADRIYGHAVRDKAGHTWLQYYFFYYYNDKSFLGIGLHEGDWEMIQLRLGPNDVPDQATYAQHDTGQALKWSDLELRDSPDGKVPVVYVGRGSHASFPSSGEHWPLFPLPPDYADGKGGAVRPALDVIGDVGPSWAGWPGKWGSSGSSPRGPSAHKQWHQPAAFHSDVSERLAAPVRRPPPPPAPEIDVHRVQDHLVVAYRFADVPACASRTAKLVVSVDTPDDDVPPATHAFDVQGPSGVVAHPAKVGDGRYVVRAVAYSPDGVQSDVVSAEVPAKR